MRKCSMNRIDNHSYIHAGQLQSNFYEGEIRSEFTSLAHSLYIISFNSNFQHLQLDHTRVMQYMYSIHSTKDLCI